MGWSSGSAQKAKALQEAYAYCKQHGKQIAAIGDSPADLARRIAFNPHHDALAGADGEELRTARADLVSLPATSDPCLTCCH